MSHTSRLPHEPEVPTHLSLLTVSRFSSRQLKKQNYWISSKFPIARQYGPFQSSDIMIKLYPSCFQRLAKNLQLVRSIRSALNMRTVQRRVNSLLWPVTGIFLVSKVWVEDALTSKIRPYTLRLWACHWKLLASYMKSQLCFVVVNEANYD